MQSEIIYIHIQEQKNIVSNVSVIANNNAQMVQLRIWRIWDIKCRLFFPYIQKGVFFL
jgi:hypothetical protein